MSLSALCLLQRVDVWKVHVVIIYYSTFLAAVNLTINITYTRPKESKTQYSIPNAKTVTLRRQYLSGRFNLR